MSASNAKDSWPELVGKNGEEAKAIIEKQLPAATVQVVPNTGMMTMDYRIDRVRVFVDDKGIIAREPRIG